MQNPIHAGFFQTFNKLKNGLKDTRGEIHLYRAPFSESPIVSLKEWKMANPVLLTRKITLH